MIIKDDKSENEAQKTIKYADIYGFLSYMCKNEADEKFIDDHFLYNLNPLLQDRNLAVEAQDVDKIDYETLKTLLRKLGFFEAFELTRKEFVSVKSAQTIMAVLNHSKIIDKDKLTLVEDVNDIDEELAPFTEEVYEKTKLIIFNI